MFLFPSLELFGQLYPRLTPERLRTLIPVFLSCSEGPHHTFLSPFLALWQKQLWGKGLHFDPWIRGFSPWLHTGLGWGRGELPAGRNVCKQNCIYHDSQEVEREGGREKERVSRREREKKEEEEDDTGGKIHPSSIYIYVYIYGWIILEITNYYNTFPFSCFPTNPLIYSSILSFKWSLFH